MTKEFEGHGPISLALEIDRGSIEDEDFPDRLRSRGWFHFYGNSKRGRHYEIKRERPVRNLESLLDRLCCVCVCGAPIFKATFSAPFHR